MHNRIDPSQARQAALRVMARSDDLAAISEDDGQLTRVYLSAEHFRANRQVAEWMRQAGMETWQDAVGNICGRYEGQTANAPAILLGSHLDSVRNAGRYDGPLGVLSAIETVSWLNEQQIRLPVAIEVIGFADEEGTRFGITLLGSKGITGRWPAAWVDHPDHQGVTVAQAMQASGLDAAKIATAARHRDAIIAYLELHIEQGPCLEQAGLALGVVTAINGARRLNCQFTGQAGHAGTVPMTHRKDALAAAAEWIVFVENCTQQRGSPLVATVGTIACEPGAVNVIAGEARLSLDIRGPEDGPLASLLACLLEEGQRIAERRGLRFTAEEYYGIPATACDPRLRDAFSDAVADVQGQSVLLPSGAGHDAIAIAECWPVAMLFVRCAGGVSHHPDESVTSDDVALAIRAYLQAIVQVATGHYPG